jgi:hypothetical protein
VNALENVVKPRIENTISYIKVWQRHREVCLLLHPCTAAVRSRPMQPIGTHPGRLAASLAVCGGVESGVGVPCTCSVLVLPRDTQLEQLARGSGAQGRFIAAVLPCCHAAQIPVPETPITFADPPVQGELDELEREEFFRLKKVQKNKQKNAARAAAEADAVSGAWAAFLSSTCQSGYLAHTTCGRCPADTFKAQCIIHSSAGLLQCCMPLSCCSVHS